jgi:hypothetical protein
LLVLRSSNYDNDGLQNNVVQPFANGYIDINLHKLIRHSQDYIYVA